MADDNSESSGREPEVKDTNTSSNTAENKVVEGAEKRFGETWERETAPPPENEPMGADGGPDAPSQGGQDASPNDSGSGGESGE